MTKKVPERYRDTAYQRVRQAIHRTLHNGNWMYLASGDPLDEMMLAIKTAGVRLAKDGPAPKPTSKP